MKVVLAYSHVDVLTALRLLGWMAFIRGKPENLLLVATQRATKTPAHKVIMEYCAEEYPNAEHWVLEDQHEVGWPRACTHMFARSLVHARDDIFWLEPDCVPLISNWWRRLKMEYQSCGTVFMGRRVPKAVHHCEHMTGVAFYGKNWRETAPKLGDPYAGKYGAWDVDQAAFTLTNFTETKLIQHEWIRSKAGAESTDFIVEPEAVLYHQCKTGALMKKLRPDFDWTPLTSRCQLLTTDNTFAMNFYLTTDSSRPVNATGKQFKFEAAEYMSATHSWWGIYATDKADEIAALGELASRGIIEELSEKDYRLLELKKKTTPGLLNLVHSQNAHGLQEPTKAGLAVKAAGNVFEQEPSSKVVEDPEVILTPRRTRKGKV